MFKEFKEFIARGNVMDLAVGIIIGGAFQKIVTSLVNDIIMPAISAITGKVDYSSLAVRIGEVSINYGNFIGAILDFLIIAFSIFIMIRYINKINKKFGEVKEQELKKIEKKLNKKNKKNKADTTVEDEVKEEIVPEPTTKVCPYCLSEINFHATRCPHCTSELVEKNDETEATDTVEEKNN